MEPNSTDNTSVSNSQAISPEAQYELNSSLEGSSSNAVNTGSLFEDSSPNLPPPPSPKIKYNKRIAIALAICGLIVISTLVLVLILSRASKKGQQKNIQNIPNQSIQTTQQPLSADSGLLKVQNGQGRLVVNGDIMTQGSYFIIGKSGASGQISSDKLTSNRQVNLPDTSGTVCLDTNNCGFLRPGDIVVTTPVNTTLNGVSGGITIQGTVNQVLVDQNGSDFVLRTPQDLAQNSSPAFANLSLGTALGLASGGTGATSASGARINLGAAASGINGDITATTALNTLVPSAAMTIGSSNQSLTLQGNGSTLLTATSSGFVTSIGFTGLPTGNVNYRFDAAEAPGTYDICTSAGNCGGGGGGTVSSPGGTAGAIAKFTGAQTIADSLISESGTTITVAGDLIASTLQGNGSAITSINASNLASGSVNDARLSANVTLAGNAFNGASQLVQLNASTQLPAVSGINLTNLNASNIASGTVNDARLSANVALLNAAQSFTSTNNFTGAGTALTVTNTASIGTVQTNTITPTAAFTAGSTGQAFTLQGNASSTITATGGGFTTTVGFSGVPTAGVAYNFDRSTAAGTYTICTTAGNCVGTGGGVTTPGGTAGTIAKFTGLQTLGDSLISESGSVVTVAGDLAATNLSGNGSAITSLNGSNITSGTVADARLSTNVTLQGNTFNGASQLVQTTAGGAFPALSGVNITNINASNIASGTLADARLSTNVTLQGNTFNGASQLVQLNASTQLPAISGINLTNLNASNLASGTVNDARLSANVALLNASQSFSGTNSFTSAGTALSVTNTASIGTVQTNLISPTGALTVGSTGQTLTLQGNATTTITATGGGFTTTVGFSGVPTAGVAYNFDRAAAAGTYTICTTAGNCIGAGGGVTTAGGTSGAIAKFTGAQTIGDSLLSESGSVVTVAGDLAATNLSGNGSAITSLNGSNISSGTVADARLSSNVTLQGNTFNGANQLVQLNASTQLPAISGINLTNLNASNVASGTLADARLSTNVTLQGNTFNGNSQLVQTTAGGALPVLSGANLTNLDASNVSSGTLADGRLSSNVALLNAAQSFTNSNSFTGAGTALSVTNTASIGTLQTNTITPTGALTVGSTAQQFTLQGNGSSTISATGGGFSTVIGFAGSPTANVTYNFDRTASVGTYTICTTAGNCVGTGGGVSTSGGTNGRLAKFTGSQTIGDSILSESGSVITVIGDQVVQGSGGVTIGVASSVSGKVVLANSTNANTITLQSGATGSNLTFTLPTADGSSGDCIKTNASGVLSFGACLSGSGGGGGGVVSLNGLSGSLNIQGTTNQITVTPGGSNVTISTPQDINTTSAPSFAGLSVTGAAGLTVGNGSNLGRLQMRDGSSAFVATLEPTTLTGNHTITIPDAAGVLAVSASGNIALSAAGNISFTGQLPVGNGGTGANSAPNARTNLGAAASGANSDITSTTALNTITPSGALTVGATTQAFTLQGSSTSTITATGGGFTTSVGFNGAPTANVTYNFDRTAAAGTYTICTTTGNCAGVGGGVTTPGGTTGTIAKFTGSQTLGDSLLSESGSVVTVAGDLAATNLSGAGAGITTLNGSNISSGTVADARLSANVTLQGNTFNGNSQLVQTTAGGALPALSGANLTSLNASNVSSGTLADARLSSNVTLQGNTFNGASQLVQLNASTQLPAVSGVNLTNLNASNIASGTLNDARLSANVALLNATQSFSGVNTFNSAGTALSVTNTASIGTLQTNTITPTGALTVGATGQAFTLQGSAGSTITATGGGFTTTVGFNGAPTANVTYNFDRAAAAGTYTICTTAGNCVGGGGGVTTAGGTSGAIAKFTGAQTLGDSIISESGSVITVAGDLAATNLSGAGSGITALNGSNISTGTVADARLSSNVTLQGNTFNGASQLVQLNGSTQLPAVSGVNLTNLNATNLASGTVNDARLSANVALLNGTQSFSGVNTFTSAGTALSVTNTASIGTLQTNTITPTGALTVGATGQAFTLQGSASSTITATGGGFATTVGFTGSPSGAVTYNFDRAAAAGTYTVCTTAGNCLGGGGGANAALSNLSSVAINTSLLTGSSTIDLGSNANPFRDLYLGGTATNNFRFTGTASAARTVTIPDADGTICFQGSSSCSFAAASGSSNYIQNQDALVQPARFSIQSATTGTPTALIQAPAGGGGAIGLIVRAGTSNTNFLTQWQDSSGVPLAQVDTNGNILTPNIVATFSISAPVISSADGASTGNIQLKSGDASAGTSGNVLVDAGTATTTAGGVYIGQTNATSVQIGRTTGASPVTILGGTGGVSIGNSGVANTLQVGNTTGAVTQTINIGNNATASSTSNVNIGSSVAGTTAIQGATTITNRTSGSANTLIVNNSSSTGNILNLQDNGTAIATIADNGATLFKNSADSTAAFAVQRAGTTTNVFAVDTTNTRVGIGLATAPSAALHINTDQASGAWSTSGMGIRVAGATYTDTTSSGTVANVVGSSFGQPTFAASSATTYTTAATLYVSNAPLAGSNVSITNAYALQVGSGAVLLGGDLVYSDGSNHTMNVAANSSANAAGNDLTIAGGAANGSTTGNIGGNLVLQGGAAAGSGNNNGGYSVLNGGTATGSGNTGGVYLQTGAGNVGIGYTAGTALPAKLSIQGSTASQITLRVQSASSQTAEFIKIADTSSNTLAQFIPQGSGNQRAQFNLYNTLEGTPTNYERLAQYADNANSVFKIETQNGGTGTLRNLVLQATAGNVGIGTSGNPGSLLSVGGTTGNFTVSTSGNIGTSGGYTQSGATANTLTGATSLTAAGTALSVTNSATVGATLQLGASAGTGAFLNNGSTINTVLALGNHASGGNIGASAAATVDIYTYISIAQTTASQSLTLRTPTASTTFGRMIYLSNTGTASFTIGGTTLNPGASGTFIWTDTNGADAWTFAGADGSSILNQTASAQSAGFYINGQGTMASTRINSTATLGTYEVLRINSPNTADANAQVMIGTNNALAKTLVVQGAIGQSAPITEWQSSAGTMVGRIYADGQFHFGYGGWSDPAAGVSAPLKLGSSNSGTDAQFIMKTAASNKKGILVYGSASQTSNLVDYYNSSSLYLSGVSSNGDITFGGDGTVHNVMTLQNASAGGWGGQLNVTAGAAGSGGLGGYGGDLHLSGGAAGNVGNYNGGHVYLNGGAPSGSSRAGDIRLQSANGGYVGIGTANGPAQLLSVGTDQGYFWVNATGDVSFRGSADHTISVAANPAAFNAGKKLTISGGQGDTVWWGAGGALELYGGAAGGGGTDVGGNVLIQGGAPTGGAAYGAVNINTTGNGNITIGNSSTASTTINGGTGSSAISLQAGSAGTISIGTSNSNVINVGTASATTHAITIGGSGAATGTITLGQSTGSQTINIANTAKGAGNSNTINLGATNNASTGTTTINIGSSNSSSGATTITLRAGTTGTTKGINTTLGNTASTNAVCSTLANTTAPTGGTTYELVDCNAAPAADFAEMYPAEAGLEVGDVVTPGTHMVNTYNYDINTSQINWNSVKGQVPQMIKETQAYSSNTFGIVSDNYLDFVSTGYNIKANDNPTSIALVGRVLVKISTENGTIQPGDFITASATKPGYAMKATQAGYVIGQALEAYTSPTDGKVMVFARTAYYPGPSPASLLGGDVNFNSVLSNSLTVNGSANIQALNVSGPTTLTNLTVTGSANIGGTLTVTNAVVSQNLKVEGSIDVDGDINLSGSVNTRNAITKKFKASSAIAAGSVVVLNPLNDGYVTTTTTSQDTKIIGVAVTAASGNGQDITVAIGGQVQVSVDAAGVTPGDLLVTNNNAGEVKSEANPRTGAVLGKATSQKGAGDKAWVLLTLQ